jgi:hypothetical protein
VRIETIPDLAAANGLIGKSDAEIRELIGDKFPKHIFHAIVSSSFQGTKGTRRYRHLPNRDTAY